ncbi:carbohydrate-binding module family 18 protein [Sporormia fimetaria CBS 119925]|uniref:Carbohydrate-binding module family 18 protein n=1 Tax=Sporormia fimetaria CBS 119925 TaxID=1340428 RepID=A0A6A6UZH0_9PLEO|nr:carbohydrate-binding module family 18 protein [Sporormia fimetaria CBS 119925]
MRSLISISLLFLVTAANAAGRVSKDGRCGKDFGGVTCTGSQFGNCCSQYGWCGRTKDHCNASTCQKAYGECTGTTATPSISKDGRCGKDFGGAICKGSQFGDCCSQYSYCGSTKDHCRAGTCQKDFGSCNGTPASPSQPASSSTPPSSAKPVSKDARCGSQFGGATCKGSKFGDCCSQHSWCGSTKDYCRADTCQKGFGDCDGAPASSVQSPTVISTSSVSSASSASPSPEPTPSSSEPTDTPESSASEESSSTDTSSTEASPADTSSTEATPTDASSLEASPTDASSTETPATATSTSTEADEPSESASSSSSVSDSATTIVVGPTTPIVEDSPPYTPTGEVLMPTNVEEFLATYTWMDEPLPTPIEMGTPPMMEGVSPADFNAVQACMIDPTKPSVTFELLDTDDRVPMVKLSDGEDGDTLGAPKAPQSEEEFLAMGDIDDIKFASFSFEGPGADGAFDLVLNESPRLYVAKAGDGSVVLVEQSLGAGDVESLSTTIFDITCEGRITIQQGGQHFEWKLRDGKSIMEPASGTPETFYALPNSPAAPLRRRSKSQEGEAPRCNNYPKPLEARVFPGARGNNPNQCGSESFNVPDLSFGSCCDQHDNDFDDCGMTFETGNDRFRSCMKGRGCDHLNKWYSYLLYVGCKKTADFYYSVVSGYFGKKAFYEANNDRCKCYCTGDNPHGCMVNGAFQCRNVLGNDNNNCGACGRTCPDISKCQRGACRCPVDQCGDRCVTLASHPRNCGACGRVSPSGYCVQGQIYTPPAVCTKGEGFGNGQFANGGDGWTNHFTASQNSLPFPGMLRNSWSVGPDPKASDGQSAAISLGPILIGGGEQTGANLRTQVKMCPGTEYRLKFQMRREVWVADAECSYAVYVAGEEKTRGSVPRPDDWVSVPEQWYNWFEGLTVGPFNGARNGVNVVGPELWADFELQIRCPTYSYNTIRLDGFTMTPK